MDMTGSSHFAQTVRGVTTDALIVRGLLPENSEPLILEMTL